MIRRRDFITLLGGTAVAWPRAMRAQEPKLPRIGVLVASDPEPFWSLFREGMRANGYIEGRNIQLEFRPADRKPNLLRMLADELVRLKVDIIVASLTPAGRRFRSSWSRRVIRSKRVSFPAWLGRAATSPGCPPRRRNST